MATKSKKKQPPPSSNNSYQLKLVTSDVCFVCKKQCARGIRYLDKMSQPGAVGKGVPCILTKYKA
ncbi:MAG: hypothetical protein K0Q81_273 [Paenibacillus sp.]|nr:hypothetical protein [Paenibacillus sp.]